MEYKGYGHEARLVFVVLKTFPKGFFTSERTRRCFGWWYLLVAWFKRYNFLINA